MQPEQFPDKRPRVRIPIANPLAPDPEVQGSISSYEFGGILGGPVDRYECTRWIVHGDNIMNFFLLYTHSHDHNNHVHQNIVVKGVQRDVGLHEHNVIQFLNTHDNFVPATFHHHVVPCLDAIDDPEQDVMVYMVMPHIHDDLFAFRDSEHYRQDYTFPIFRNVLQNVRHLHGLGVCHLDLKPENIVIDPDPKRLVTSLIDMETCLRLPQNGGGLIGKEFLERVTREYVSFEIYANQDFDGAKADVWSLGVTLFFLLTGRRIYNFPGDDYYLTFWEEGDEGTRRLKDRQVLLQFADEVIPNIENLDDNGETLLRARIAAVGGIQDQVWTLLRGMLDEDMGRRFTLARVQQEVDNLIHPP